MGDGYKRKQLPNHPLAMANGQVNIHRQTLWDHLHPHHPDPYTTYNRCHWCNWPQYWRVKQSAGTFSTASINVDHLDENKTNNNISNLVPSCGWCNTNRTGIKQTIFQKMAHLYSETPPKKRPSLRTIASAQPGADGAIEPQEIWI